MKSWKEFIENESKEDYFVKLMAKVNEAYASETVYPSKEEMFSCFDLCPYENVKVVIIGQDPYHGAGQAHGLSFSVKPGVKVPPSLKNIYKELKTDLDIDAPNHGYLASWAKQGVLMMNTSWTVSEGKAGSHKKFGWAKFTQRVLEVLNNYDKPLVFILWGNHAIDAAKGVTNPKHCLLKGIHPSPLAGGGFFGSKPFSQTNAFLEKVGRGAIDWTITNEIETQVAQTEKISTSPKATETASKVKESIPVTTESPRSGPPKFKKIWENIKEVDTSNDLIIREYPGIALKIIDLDGKQVLLAKNKLKLEFIDPYTFKPIYNPFTLGLAKTDIFAIKFIKINNEWCVVYELYNENVEVRFQIIVYNLVTKQTTVLHKTSEWVSELITCHIDNQAFAFFIMRSSRIIIKYNLQTFKEESRFEIPAHDRATLHYFVNNNLPTLLLEHKVSRYPDSQYQHYIFFNANTGKQIGQPNTLHEKKDTKVVQVSNNKYVFAVVTKYNHLHLFDTATGEQTHDILVDEDPEYTIAVFGSLTAYKSKLIIASWTRTKVYDLAHPEQEPHLLVHTDGSPVQTKDHIYAVEYQGKPMAFLPGGYNGTACFSLETYSELPDVQVIPTMDIVPFIDQQNRELFIVKYGEPWGADPYTVLYNPQGRIRPSEEFDYNYCAINTRLNGASVIITKASNNYINIFDTQTGKVVKSVKMENAGQIKQMLITQIKGEQALLALSDKGVKGYTFPDMKEMGFDISIDYICNIDIIEMEGKKQLIGGKETFFTWDMETGEFIHNPLKIAFDYGEDAEKDNALRSDGLFAHTLNWGANDSLFISLVESEAYLWNPNQPDKLQSFTIDDTMWGVESDDPDYGFVQALSTVVNGKEVVVTASHHGAIVVFNPETGQRIGRIMRARYSVDEDYIKIMDLGEQKLLVTYDDYNVKVWNLVENKKLKDFNFEGKVTSVAIADHKIIVCNGENITAIEVK